MMMRKLIITVFTTCIYALVTAQSYQLVSPDNRLIADVDIDDSIVFSIKRNKDIVIQKSTINMAGPQGYLSSNSPKLDSAVKKNHSSVINVLVSSKDATIKDEYNELILYFNQKYALNFRAYNDGVAYRFITFFTDSIDIVDEIFDLNLPDGATALFPKENSLVSHNERMYIPVIPDTLTDRDFCSLPLYINSGKASMIITESDLYDYPNMFMAGAIGSDFTSIFPKRVIDSKPRNGSDRNQELTYSTSSIAYTKGNRTFPWRIIVIGENDADLVESNLVFQLASPMEIEDPSWIKPGKVAWDWYNANSLYGVDLISGINTETYKFYIDFASDYGLEYIILDEGWSISTTDISCPNKDIDLAELIEYGKQKDVGIILWVLWEPLDKNMEILKEYHSWGIVGIKVDFMQRSDQYMVNYYEKVAREAAKHQLLVDFHGSFKPSGLRRAYPNVLTYEGLKGNENNKWSALITPKHNVTLPFIRMVSGPMDYTPGAMRNANIENHNISFTRPVSIGTRCHQAAMYVVYESPLQMLCDSPSNYIKDSDFTTLISRIPSTWDETIVMEGKVGEYITVARRKDNHWYIGAMTDSARNIEIDLSFLSKGNYLATILKDGKNATNYAEDYSIEQITIKKSDKLIIPLANGGGMVAIIR